MEVQLEEEYDDKQKVLKERRELEAKLCSAKEEVNQRTRLHSTLWLPVLIFRFLRLKGCKSHYVDYLKKVAYLIVWVPATICIWEKMGPTKIQQCITLSLTHLLFDSSQFVLEYMVC